MDVKWGRGEIKREPESIYTTRGQTETRAVLVISKLSGVRVLRRPGPFTSELSTHMGPLSMSTLGPGPTKPKSGPIERFGLQVHDIRVQEKEDSITSPLEFSSWEDTSSLKQK